MPHVIPSSHVGTLDQRTLRQAFCWELNRTDGASLPLTNHNGPLVMGGVEFDPVDSWTPSAHRLDSALKDHSFDANGVITSDKISDEDILAGRYEDAQLIEHLVDWRAPWAGPILSRFYWVTTISHDGEQHNFTLTGPTRYLRARSGGIFDRVCGADLGDARCKVPLATNTVFGVRVAAVLDGLRRRIIRAEMADVAASFVDGWFDYGEVQFTSGANAGLVGEIKSYTAETRQIDMQLPLPYDVAIGDTFDLVVGCDKLKSTCINKFANIDNFRGHPFMPGTDRILKTPE